jgi:site-specific DNA-methyltransferase (adenine-specific)/site-specific DNA-methyltransferase (cytosine-N4-specific)
MSGALHVGDCLRVLQGTPAESFQACITSPPYWGLRDYGVEGQIGAEPTVDAYLAHLVGVFREVRRTLKKNGTLWLNVGDSYTSGGRTWRDPDKKNPARGMTYRAATPAGLKPKDLIGVPWKLAFALQADGWYLRSDVIWSKPNPQPESVKDRPTRAHEYVFLLSKRERYFYDAAAVKEPAADGRSKRARRTVWTVQSEPLREAHFATFPPKLVEPCVLASTRTGDVIVDPFFGAGTVGVVAEALGRKYFGVELNEAYAAIARRRLGRGLKRPDAVHPLEAERDLGGEAERREGR